MPTFPNRDIRNIGIEGGRPEAFADLGEDQSRIFGMAILDLLKQYQKIGTKGYVQQELGAREQQARRLSFTEPGLIGAAPSVQAGAREASVSALTPTIKGAQESQQTFGEQIKSFGTTIDKAFNILQQEETRQDKERDDARAVIKDALTIFGSKGADIVDPKYWKTAGYDEKSRSLMKDTLKERELELKLEKARDLGGKPLSILDIQRYQELYPEAGIVAGDTEVGANQKVQALNSPRDFTRQELIVAIQEDKSNKKKYEEVITDIGNNTLITNKDEAKMVADEVYNKSKSNQGIIKRTFGLSSQQKGAIAKTFEGTIFDFLFKK